MGMEFVHVRLSREELRELLASLRSRLKEVDSRLREVESRLRMFEEKYGVGTSEFLEIIRKSEEREVKWPFPDDADMDLIEWEGYARLRSELLRERKGIERLIAKLGGSH